MNLGAQPSSVFARAHNRLIRLVQTLYPTRKAPHEVESGTVQPVGR